MRPGPTLSALTLDAALAVRGMVVDRLLRSLRPADPEAAPVSPPVATRLHGLRHVTPVVLVHGYGGTRSTWSPLERRLQEAGVSHLHTLTYSPFAPCVPEIARSLVRECRRAMARAGTDRVHLVGHSLGGVVVRFAVQELGLEPHVATAVTVASPHGGTPAALLARGTLVASLRPGSPLLAQLRRQARTSDVRWVSYYSDADLVVRPRSSRLDEPSLGASNVLVPGTGHLGIVRSPVFLASVVDLLTRDTPGQVETPAATAA
ncbi:esterase/lipase family protein [Geodermatophilus poikilotrophus]|uniref:Alpha/beta hydrolase family protein n=1 Tax=Geodermatophilus poikilotrophus TaxID=1333667 RepID=A0A1H9ZDZ7_9ACTN|nr:alpha/beta fold hydrolase [Geodermatophilus poikilotrophus]SES79075.1 Alpha/beta hydrolase family protein [Geodermatophilus poikilotrophus]